MIILCMEVSYLIDSW